MGERGPLGVQGLDDLPADIGPWLEGFVQQLAPIIGDGLDGVYLHGSLATGDFVRGSSDVDLLLATREPLTAAQRVALRDLLLERSTPRLPIEISSLSRAERRPWRHPCPFDWHFSEAWRDRMAASRAVGTEPAQPATDPDLAAHVTMLHARGRTLLGLPADEAFPPVPRTDFLASVLAPDVAACLATLRDAPAYGVLNLCRLGMYARTGRLGSKREGALWALAEARAPLPALTRRALSAYDAGDEDERRGWDAAELAACARQWTDELKDLSAPGG